MSICICCQGVQQLISDFWKAFLMAIRFCCRMAALYLFLSLTHTSLVKVCLPIAFCVCVVHIWLGFFPLFLSYCLLASDFRQILRLISVCFSFFTPIQMQTALAIEVDGEVCGGVAISLGTDISRLTAEIGYWLGEQHWGKGIVPGCVYSCFICFCATGECVHRDKSAAVERVGVFI